MGTPLRLSHTMLATDWIGMRGSFVSYCPTKTSETVLGPARNVPSASNVHGRLVDPSPVASRTVRGCRAGRRTQALRHHHTCSLINRDNAGQQVAAKLKATRVVACPARPTANASTSNNG
jgi:hypothetical protein